MKDLKLIEDFSNAFGPAGYEEELLEVVKSHLDKSYTIERDAMNNIYIWGELDENKPTIMLDAHLDEVGFIVQNIRPNGLLEFLPLGGWTNYTIPAHLVYVRNRSGKLIKGIITSKPPHFTSDAERGKAPDISDMAIDIGASSAEEVREKFNIEIACPVAPDTEFEYLEDADLLMGKAFDCRIGCASLISTMNKLVGENLAVNVVGSLSVQEELGLRGAGVTANRIKPDLAIVFEGTPADDTVLEGYKVQTALRKGPMLRHFDRVMVTNPRYQWFALDLARELDIPVQSAVRSGGGTNAGSIHLSNHGVPSIVMAVPSRYIHTHYGYAAYEDYENTVKLAYELLKRLDQDRIDSF